MLVSILSITYNHEPYLEKALDSFLSQKTDFEFEIVIGDDCSKDRTKEILLDYQRRYPGKFRLLLNEKNIGMMPNLIQTFHACNGKYIAVCEGDDYWVDDHKLQRQVDILEKNEGVSICSHSNYELRNGELVFLYGKKYNKERTYKLQDYLLHPFFHTSSFVLRKMNILPDWYKDVYAGDNFLALLFSSKGDIYFFPEPMSVYRINTSSISNRLILGQLRENYVYHLQKFNELTGRKYEKDIKRVIKKWELNTKWVDKNYSRKLKFFVSNFLFFCRNYRRFFSMKLMLKYITPNSILRRIRPKLSGGDVL